MNLYFCTSYPYPYLQINTTYKLTKTKTTNVGQIKNWKGAVTFLLRVGENDI